MILDEATLARFERLLLDADTVERYRKALAGAPDSSVEAFASWVVAQAQGMPQGTLLPLRAAANHVLQARFGLSDPEAQMLLPPARGRPPGERDHLDREQLALFYDIVEHMDPGPVQAVLLLIPRTALRISEIVRLRRTDRAVHQGSDALRVVGKGNKVRHVRLSRVAAHVLDSWLEDAPDSEWLFPGRSPSRHVTTEAVSLACRRMRKDNPELGHLTPHVLRHTWATAALNAGVDLKRVQVVLGHKRLETTSIYLHASGDGLRDAMEAAEVTTESE